MQERRTIIRVRYACRAHYCPPDEPTPRDGQLLTLSERGASLLVRETQPHGSHLTVTYPLNGHDAMTATGVVRWSEPAALADGWHPVGIEWLPLDDTVRHRLERFLHQHAIAPSPSASPAGQARRRSFRRPSSRAVQISIGLSLLFGLALCAAAFSGLRGEHRDLQTAFEQRTDMLERVERQDRVLRHELALTHVQLSDTTQELLRLSQQAKQIGATVEQLSQEVDRVEQSNEAMADDREQLMQRVMDLAHERTWLVKRLAMMETLQTVIDDAMAARRAPDSIVPSATASSRTPQGARRLVVSGVLQDPARASRAAHDSPLHVVIHEPETSDAADPASSAISSHSSP